MSHIRTREFAKWDRRERRAHHVRHTVYGTPERPRLTVYRSHRHFHAQIIDDTKGHTLASASSLQKDLKGTLKHGGDRKAAEAVGARLAAQAKAKGVTKVVFDRNFYKFHGRVRAFAEAVAKGGLDFLFNPKKKGKAPKQHKPKAEAKPAKEAKPQKPQKSPAEGHKPKEEKK